MTIRYYIMPFQAYQADYLYRWPKYFAWNGPPRGVPAGGIEAPYSWMDYGLIPAALVVADVTQAQHDELDAYSDVAAAPVDIDQNVSVAAIPRVQNVLEALRIPAGWVDTSYTYRQILRMIAGLFQFSQRHHAMHNEDLIPNVAALNLQWNQIPAARRTRIQATVADLGYDTSGITNQTLVRQILWNFAQQWGERPFHMGGQVL